MLDRQRARSTNKATAPSCGSQAAPGAGTSSGGKRSSCSSGRFSSSWLVTSRCTCGAAASACTSAAVASSTCSTLSNTSSARRDAIAAASTAGRFAAPSAGSATPSTWATLRGSSAGSRSGAASIHQTPSGQCPRCAWAPASARLVLPMPPGPTTLTRRCACTSAASVRSASSRPISRCGAGGSRPGGGAVATADARSSTCSETSASKR